MTIEIILELIFFSLFLIVLFHRPIFKNKVILRLNFHICFFKLTQKVDFTSTLMFCSQNKSHYLGMEQKTPFVRYLSSNKTEDIKNSQCTRLEEPNFIGDLPAACK